ncbi:MAG: hypothetical protein IJE23_03670 [Tyzzerella sp.]|nr:hypothetical protein [Tyzzerella sp.]
MNKLILCEGETDAILLSYYLGKIAGWKYCEKAPKNIDIKKHNDNESVNWYKKGKDYLLICGVGGKDNFGRFFELETFATENGVAIPTKMDMVLRGHWNCCWLLFQRCYLGCTVSGKSIQKD